MSAEISGYSDIERDLKLIFFSILFNYFFFILLIFIRFFFAFFLAFCRFIRKIFSFIEILKKVCLKILNLLHFLFFVITFWRQETHKNPSSLTKMIKFPKKYWKNLSDLPNIFVNYINKFADNFAEKVCCKISADSLDKFIDNEQIFGTYNTKHLHTQ